MGNTFEHTADIVFRHARFGQFHGRRVHFVTNGGSAFQFGNFFGRLLRAQFHHGVNQRDGGLCALFGGMNAEQVHNLDLRVVAVGWEIVHLASAGLGLAYSLGQCGHRLDCGYATLSSHVGHRSHRAIPHDVVNVDFVAIERFGAAVGVKEHIHIGIDVLVNLLPQIGRRIIAIVVQVILCGFDVFLIKFGINLVNQTMKQPSAGLQIPMGYVYWAIPVLGGLGIFYSIREIVHLAKGEAKGEGELPLA